ncbi:Integrase (Fragment), partial [Nocardioides sp. PD653-B2]
YRPGHLLRRPRLALATRHQREHQRSAAPVLPQRHRPLPVGTRDPRPGSPRDEQPPPQDPRMAHPRRSPRRPTLTTRQSTRRCTHRL